MNAIGNDDDSIHLAYPLNKNSDKNWPRQQKMHRQAHRPESRKTSLSVLL